MTVLIIVEAAAILLLGLLVAGLLRSHAEILRRLHELGAGVGDHTHQPDGNGRRWLAAPARASSPAHDLSGTTLDDQAVGVAVRGVGHGTLLAFLSSGCLTCAGFWEAFRSPERLSLPRDTRLVVVTKDPEEESPAALRRLAPEGVPVVMSGTAWQDYRVPGSPYFVYADGPSGRVAGEGTAATWAQVENLLGQAVADARSHGDAYREARADRELMAAGIYPGHLSLYAEGEDPEEESS
ncbi:MAG: hypothetical protein ACRDXD_00680 [Acidimicrobiia bacterium]